MQRRAQKLHFLKQFSVNDKRYQNLSNNIVNTHEFEYISDIAISK